ncbi:MAG: hypothetical protein ACP5FH_02310 [Terracidiphilus sp.]
MRLIAALLLQSIAICCCAQQVELPDAPQPSPSLLAAGNSSPDSGAYSSPADPFDSFLPVFAADTAQAGQPAQSTSRGGLRSQTRSDIPLDANGKPIPIERRQPRRILGFIPNFRSVSGGAVAHPPGWKYSFTVATHQATDYSSFFFLGLTSLIAEGTGEHPVLGKGVEGFYAYTWRGFIDKTDGTYLSAWLLPSLLHEDTRYYALGAGHSVTVRAFYVISQEAVARNYEGRDTPNIAGLGGKVLTQVFSRYYYPPGTTSFSDLATKFSYSVMRDVGNSAIREFYPDIAAYYLRRHRKKAARRAAQKAASTPSSGSPLHVESP